MDQQLHSLFSSALASGIDEEELKKISGLNSNVEPILKKPPFSPRKYLAILSVLVVLYAIKAPDSLTNPIDHFGDLFKDYIVTKTDQCLMTHSGMSLEMTRPVSDCALCEGMPQIPVIENMTQEYFLKHHAYTGRPVLIKGAVSNWTALKVFSYKYFKKLYSKLEALEENEELGCQFFSYKTNLYSLKQLFSMSKKRSELKKDQWYVGWSNCVPRVMKILRKHYDRPTFLPDDSESSSLDWMFMGGSGTGADMHIDAVDRPSWQAMIKGKKTWYFKPPPECTLRCTASLSATMEPGDILVVDTNKWFHSTYIHPGELSITIGSEYD